MEICPKCHDYTLSYDPSRRTAICCSCSCNFEESVNGLEDYFNTYVISELNWDNYCAKTPLFIRKLRGTLEPIPGT
jgi:hypothetical protein